ncbi:MAG TPA: DUF4124 domain-containing protein, partial [Tahibacter sp.]|nr:DUF4124 domain-containing protein [Tahibacter sp.]
MKNTFLANACLAVAALLAAPAATASNDRTFYKCVDANGVTTFQAAPCAAGSQQSEVKLREPPPEAQSPGGEEVPQTDPATGLPIEKPVVVSYECTTAQGWTFYKHRPCPPGVRLAPTGAA